MSAAPAPILYCHCAYAKIVPAATKQEVLERLVRSGVPFEAVPDLCEMSARKDPALARHAETEGLRTVACYPRAVRWLYHAAGSPREEGAEVRNMRVEDAGELFEVLMRPAGEPAPPTPDAEEPDSGEAKVGAAGAGEPVSGQPATPETTPATTTQEEETR